MRASHMTRNAVQCQAQTSLSQNNMNNQTPTQPSQDNWPSCDKQCGWQCGSWKWGREGQRGPPRTANSKVCGGIKSTGQRLCHEWRSNIILRHFSFASLQIGSLMNREPTKPYAWRRSSSWNMFWVLLANPFVSSEAVKGEMLQCGRRVSTNVRPMRFFEDGLFCWQSRTGMIAGVPRSG